MAGTINGARLASAAPYADHRSPPAAADSLPSVRVVVRCEARHNNAKGENRKSETFRNVRKALHLRVGAKVMLCLNQIWNVTTVPLGLMNGARGIIVAISYAPLGQERLDAQPLAAATALPSPCRDRPPRPRTIVSDHVAPIILSAI